MVKVKRTKHSRRVMTYYKFRHGFEPPYNVLVDGTFCQAALDSKIALEEQVSNYLIEPTRIVTTKCIINELEKLGKDVYGALVIAKQFKVVMCPHSPLRTASECIAHLARRSHTTGKDKYLVGTQDDALITKLRLVGGVPLLAIRYKTVILEKPAVDADLPVDHDEIEKAREMKMALVAPSDKEAQKRKKKIKGKNPLSCKKKQKKVITGARKSEAERVKKTRRRKKKTRPDGVDAAAASD